VATANHYWIDGIVGIALIIPGVLATRWHPIARVRARWFTARASGVEDVQRADHVQRDDLVQRGDLVQGDDHAVAPGALPSPRSPSSGEEPAQRRLTVTERS
jgi:hypothetical protein